MSEFRTWLRATHSPFPGLPTVPCPNFGHGCEGHVSNQRFCIIPARALDSEKLKGNDLKVLCYFGKHADRNGWWFLSQVKMARYLNLARSTIQLSINRLIEAELLEKHPIDTESGRDSAHYYRVVFDHGAPETGVPKEVAETRKNRVENDDQGGADISAGVPDTPAGGADSGSAGGADSGSAGGADSGSAPSITTHTNAPLSRGGRAPSAAPEREVEENGLEGEDLSTFEGEAKFWKLVKAHPDSAGMPKEAWKVEWNKLSLPDRKLAFERHGVWIDWLRQRKKSHVPVLGTYFRERLFDDMDDPKPEPEKPVECKPFGQAWMAKRIWLVDQPRRHWPISRMQQKLIDAGKPELTTDGRHVSEFPEVHDMDLKAENRRGFFAMEADLPPYKHLVSTAVGGDLFEAWRAWHERHDVPLIKVPAGREYVYLPPEVPDKGPAVSKHVVIAEASAEEFLEAINAGA